VANPRTVYRFVQVSDPQDEALVDDFESDLASGKRPFRREKVYPELREGMSVFGSLKAAREAWEMMRAAAEGRGQALRAGEFIAEVQLGSDRGFDLEDLQETDEHMTVWGDPADLAAAVSRIYPAITTED